jgi:hypothetical protein
MMLFLPGIGAAQTQVESKPNLSAPGGETARFITLTVENDSLGSGADRNYTNGFNLTYHNTGHASDYLKDMCRKYVPFFEINQTTSMYYTLGQNMYTPDDITARTPDPEDRPYAGFLYGSFSIHTLQQDHVDEFAAAFGVVGPWALGEVAQESVHDLLRIRDPSGWDHQLDNEPAINLSYQRQWPKAYSKEYGPLYFRAAPHVRFSVGNVFTYAAAGVLAQWTPQRNRWQSQPLRIRPAFPGSGFFTEPAGMFSWSVFMGLEGRAMGRNIFLDGNTFEDSPSVDKKYFVADASGGISFTLKRTRISYSVNWRSEEFEGQDEPSVFGIISIGHRF